MKKQWKEKLLKFWTLSSNVTEKEKNPSACQLLNGIHNEKVLVKNKEIYDLVIVGGGPSGMAAAIYARTFISNILLIEKRVIGGKASEILLTNDYTGDLQNKGLEITSVMKKQILETEPPIVIKKLEVVSIQKKNNLFLIKERNCEFFYSYSTIITTGSNWRKLKLEKTKSVHYKNFSYKVMEDAHLTKNKEILIIGGGYSGCQTADFLASFAKKVHLVHRKEELNINSNLKNKILENDKIEVYLNSFPLETNGKERVESCTILVNGTLQKKLMIDMIFPCIGTVPNSELVKKLVDLTKEGNIKVDNSFQTKSKGLFAAGDVTLKNNRSQITTAIAEGTQAARAAIKYLCQKKLKLSF